MKTKRRALQVMREAVRRGPDRSALFWWMVDHHSELVKDGATGRMPWQRLCKNFVAEGLTDGNGKPPTPARAGKTWREACIAVEGIGRRASSTAQKPLAPPSRQHPDWQPPLADAPRTAPALQYRRDEPEEVLPPRQTDLSPPSQAPPASSKPKTIADLSPEGRAKIERLKRTLQEDDRKKFGHM